MDFYWELIQHDGTRIEIPPEAVPIVKRRWNENLPIHTDAGSVPASQIKAFRPTDRPYSRQSLVEAAAQAFNEPIYNPDTSVVVRWVKKQVPQRTYAKHYAAIPAYNRLGEEGTVLIVAFRLPVHFIDLTKVSYCTDDEVRLLEKG